VSLPEPAATVGAGGGATDEPPAPPVGDTAPEAGPVEAGPVEADPVGVPAPPEPTGGSRPRPSSPTTAWPSCPRSRSISPTSTPGLPARARVTPTPAHLLVGMTDAVALSHVQRRIPTPRPLTHELMTEVLQRFDIDLVAVRIVGRAGNVYFAELDLRGGAAARSTRAAPRTP